MSDSNRVTRRIFFTGRVQGVGFRWTTSRIAVEFPVTGFVRNMADGRVELVVQGDAAATGGLLKEVQHQLAANIQSIDEETVDAPEDFHRFEIRR